MGGWRMKILCVDVVVVVVVESNDDQHTNEK